MSDNQKLSKIKQLIEQSITEENNQNFYLGQAVGILDDMIGSKEAAPSSIDIPSHILKLMNPDSDATMENAVSRHKKHHQELSDNAISKQNTQFKKLT